MGSELHIFLQNLSGKTALPKIQLSTILEESKAENVTSIIISEYEILLR